MTAKKGVLPAPVFDAIKWSVETFGAGKVHEFKDGLPNCLFGHAFFLDGCVPDDDDLHNTALNYKATPTTRELLKAGINVYRNDDAVCAILERRPADSGRLVTWEELQPELKIVRGE